MAAVTDDRTRQSPGCRWLGAVLGLCLLGVSIEAGATPPSLAAVDQALVSALRAPDEPARQAALRTAQEGLDALDAAQQPATVAPQSDDGSELTEEEATLGRLQQGTALELRQTLMRGIWESPYGGLPEAGMQALERVSDLLRLLHEGRRLGDGDPDAVEALQATYWQWLTARANTLGLAAIALSNPEAPVFDQRVLRRDDGAVVVYELLGRADRTLQWQAVSAKPVPEGLLTAGALRVDLDREAAPWLLVIQGSNLAETLAAHRHWLAAIARRVRLVPREQAAYGQALDAASNSGSNPHPYVLPATDTQAPARLSLIQVGPARVIGSWPLDTLSGANAGALKELVNRILAAGQ